MKRTLIRRYAIIILVFYFLLLSYWMLLGFGRTTNIDYMYNLEPFSTIKMYLQFEYFNFSTWIINLIGNIGVFMPFGVLLPIVFRSSFIKSLLIFELGLLMLEVTQLITKRGSFDIDDFILNTIGYVFGFMSYKFTFDLYKKKT